MRDEKYLTRFFALLISLIGDMNFGQKLRKLRIEKGLTQQELAERLGYKTNSYVSDVESGHFIPSRDKLKKIARALDVPFKVLEDMLLESRLEALGIKEPELLSLFKDIPSLPERDKRAIINAYLKVKERRMRKKKT
jgi:transcriptional regulator with XRE-family HTH domain